ncbi:MAG: hypothetical protein NT023_22425 [Armatimonadetes bacterium]|nr:hypothetical protein [Armatimonadota bacterium]
MVTATGVYPEYQEQIKRLVERHKENQYDPLLLAVYYAPEREETDVFLFEVIEDFNSGSLDESGDMLEVRYGTTPAFPMPYRNGYLHITLTNPDELAEARGKNTPLFVELKTALSEGKAEIIYCRPDKASLCEALG